MTHIFLQLAYLCAIGFCSYTTGWLLIRARRNQMVWALAACQLLVVVWCVPKLLFPYSTNVEMKFVLYAISYIGISLIGPAWLLFSFLYCRRSIALRARCLLFGGAVFDYGMFLTNGAHHLFYREFELGYTQYGPFLYVHMLYTYCCVLLGMGAVLREFGKKKVAVSHMTLIIFSAAVPLGLNLLYISRLIRSSFDLTPPAFALSSFLMFLAVFQHDLLDVNVLAFEQIFGSIAEGVLVYNKRGVVTYCNQAAGEWLGAQEGEDMVLVRERLASLGVMLELEGKNARGKGSAEKDPSRVGPAKVRVAEEDTVSQVLSLPDGVRLRLKQYICRDKKGAAAAGTLLLTDVGEYYELLQQSRELAVSEQRLAIEQERNRIAQEVHDTTGHTLTMIRSLIKLIRVACKEQGLTEGREGRQEPEEGLEGYLDQAQALAAEGIRQLRLSINHLRQGTCHELVTQGVYQLAQSVKELKVEVEIQGKDGPEYSHLSGIVYSCLREAVTNCLRYADAARMDVIVKFTRQDVSLYIFDDGRGCDHIQESHGIRGIRERAEKAGGQVRFLSAEGEGFQIYMKLPVEDREGGNV